MSYDFLCFVCSLYLRTWSTVSEASCYYKSFVAAVASLKGNSVPNIKHNRRAGNFCNFRETTNKCAQITIFGWIYIGYSPLPGCNRGKWNFRLGIPTRNIIILVVTSQHPGQGCPTQDNINVRKYFPQKQTTKIPRDEAVKDCITYQVGQRWTHWAKFWRMDASPTCYFWKEVYTPWKFFTWMLKLYEITILLDLYYLWLFFPNLQWS